jgi:hypothetical protein
MYRLLTIAPALILLAALAPAAPVPPDRKPVPYMATTRGTVWTYADGKSEYTDVVTGVEKKADGAVVVTIARKGKDRAVPVSVVEVSARGLYRVSNGTAAVDPPRCLLKLPAKPGDTWEHAPRPPGRGQPGVYTLKGEEEVEVPAGKYKALRVDAVLEWPDGPRPTTYWYAPGVGRVKMVSVSAGVERVEALKAFVPGKD